MDPDENNLTQLAEGIWRWDGDAKVDSGKWVENNGPEVTVPQPLTAKTDGDLVEGWYGQLPFNDYLRDGWLPLDKHRVE